MRGSNDVLPLLWLAQPGLYKGSARNSTGILMVPQTVVQLVSTDATTSPAMVRADTSIAANALACLGGVAKLPNLLHDLIRAS